LTRLVEARDSKEIVLTEWEAFVESLADELARPARAEDFT